MALDMDVVGKTFDPLTFDYAWKDTVLYALGVGAKADELDYLYEGRGPKVLPTFAVVPSFTALVDTLFRAQVPLEKVLHGEQRVVLHAPIPPAAKLKTHATVRGIYDKGKGALVAIECATFLAEGNAGGIGGGLAAGTPLFDNFSSIFVRGEGGFDGPRGPEPEKLDVDTTRAPDFSRTETIPREQALLYRLSGDLNPLHADPEMAKRAGFDAPILHGLCSFGYAGRAILHDACGGDVAKLRSFGARFAGIVIPGDTLTTRGWRMADGRWFVDVVSQAGKTVLSHGVVEVS